ncbi:MAG TPA: CoA pyrophosphatase, partial [Ktedonobacteraceae bacterium]|nr:CoA pyrophosphatase [Ktedonobacteraceae bacterium]
AMNFAPTQQKRNGCPSHLCYNNSMDYQNIHTVVQVLRERLEPVERADLLIDALEGQRPTARKAAVLICLFDQNAESRLVFIRRATTLRSHSGEIAFPGGSVDHQDASFAMTALREAQEEIGLDPARVELLGIMPPVFTVVSNFLITPVVAYLPRGPGELRLQPSEVDELLIFPLEGLANPAIYHTEEWTRGGVARTVYFFDYGSNRIWGATARMLNALLDVLRRS